MILGDEIFYGNFDLILSDTDWFFPRIYLVQEYISQWYTLFCSVPSFVVIILIQRGICLLWQTKIEQPRQLGTILPFHIEKNMTFKATERAFAKRKKACFFRCHVWQFLRKFFTNIQLFFPFTLSFSIFHFFLFF